MTQSLHRNFRQSLRPAEAKNLGKASIMLCGNYFDAKVSLNWYNEHGTGGREVRENT